MVYSSWESIRDTLDYDFAQEKQFSYDALSVPDSIRHIAKFASGIWQIRPFCEGNTRATAVFVVKYLKTFGFTVNNDVFAANSWYFRNALVRAHYNNLQKGIHATGVYLEWFFENLLLGTQHELNNRYLHVEYEKSKCQYRGFKVPKWHFGLHIGRTRSTESGKGKSDDHAESIAGRHRKV